MLCRAHGVGHWVRKAAGERYLVATIRIRREHQSILKGGIDAEIAGARRSGGYAVGILAARATANVGDRAPVGVGGIRQFFQDLHDVTRWKPHRLGELGPLRPLIAKADAGIGENEAGWRGAALAHDGGLVRLAPEQAFATVERRNHALIRDGPGLCEMRTRSSHIEAHPVVPRPRWVGGEIVAAV